MNPTEDLNDLANQAEDPDPEVALVAIGVLQDWAATWLTRMEAEAVVRARAEGYPWGRIAGHLGRSKQGVWEKYRDSDEHTAD
jgi:hypothetical protein